MSVNKSCLLLFCLLTATCTAAPLVQDEKTISDDGKIIDCTTNSKVCDPTDINCLKDNKCERIMTAINTGNNQFGGSYDADMNETGSAGDMDDHESADDTDDCSDSKDASDRDDHSDSKHASDTEENSGNVKTDSDSETELVGVKSKGELHNALKRSVRSKRHGRHRHGRRSYNRDLYWYWYWSNIYNGRRIRGRLNDILTAIA